MRGASKLFKEAGSISAAVGHEGRRVHRRQFEDPELPLAPAAQRVRVSKFRWGVFGTGAISAKFILGLAAARNAEVSFVASRSQERASKLANSLGVRRAYGGYDAALKAGGVDAVYVATPPSEHAAQALMCLNAGVAVLVEKPFAPSEAEASRIAEVARSRSVFAMEAMWTRFLPAAAALRGLLATGRLGQPRMVTGNFGTSQVPSLSNGIFNPALGGGALSHLGAYPISLGQWLFGEAEVLRATGVVGATGVDETVAFMLRYPDDVIGSFYVSVRAWAPDEFHVAANDGHVGFEGSIVRPTGIRIAHETPRDMTPSQLDWRERIRQSAFVHTLAQRIGRSSRAGGAVHRAAYGGNGYHYEADEVESCVRRGAVQSDVMPLSDSVSVARTMDAIRDSMRN